MLLRLILCLLMLTAPAVAKPNVVLILADDFSMNLMPAKRDGISKSMPNLARMMREGMSFNKFIVSNSLCCPSRASIFTGLLPHNTGVLTNGEPLGGYFAFMEHGDETKTFATVMQTYDYKTAFMGKYLNGWLPNYSPIPVGWDQFASTNRGYQGYGYTLNNNGVLTTPPDHFTDTINKLGRDWIGTTPGPFFLELATFSPHSPYTPPKRYNLAFLDVVMPKTPAFDARPDSTAPEWLQIIPQLRDNAKKDFEQAYILRVQSSKGIDDMIGDVRRKLERLGLSANTYVIFTSDNGYHMGEMSLRIGKMTPFDMDSLVPFVIVGPGIVPGSTSDALVQNIDLAPTFAELAGAPPMADVDGRSMVPLFTGGVSTRRSAVIEHERAPFDPNDPDATDPRAGDPPTYIALRMADSMYVEYDTGEIGYYDMTTDPDQLHNVAASLSPERLAELHAAALANQTCAGAGACQAAQDLP